MHFIIFTIHVIYYALMLMLCFLYMKKTDRYSKDRRKLARFDFPFQFIFQKIFLHLTNVIKILYFNITVNFHILILILKTLDSSKDFYALRLFQNKFQCICHEFHDVLRPQKIGPCSYPWR